MTTLSLRCSSLPRLAACAAALDPAPTAIEGPRGPADLGTAFHAMISAIISGTADALSEESFAETAARCDVDEGELRPLVFWAARAWGELLSQHYPGATVEHHMHADDTDAGVSLDGHADVIAYDDESREVRVLDWKSGWSDMDYRDQLRGYGLLGLLEYPDATSARVSKVQVREQRIDTRVYTRVELNEWWAGLTQHLRRRDVYRPGQHCAYCPRALTCEARATLLQSAWLWLVNPEDKSPRSVVDMIGGAKAVKKAAEQFLEATKTDVKAHGGKKGPLSIAKSERRKVRLDRGFDVLTEQLGLDRVKSLVKVSNGDMQDAAKEAAPRGQKGKVVAALWDRLEQVGAVEIETVETLEVDFDGTDSKPAAIESADATARGIGGADAGN